MRKNQPTKSKSVFLRNEKQRWDKYFEYLSWDNWEAMRDHEEYKKRFEKTKKRRQYRTPSFFEKPNRERRKAVREVSRKLKNLDAKFYVWFISEASKPLSTMKFNQWEDIVFLSKNGDFFWNCTISTCTDELKEDFSDAFFLRYNELAPRMGETPIPHSESGDNEVFKRKASSGAFYEKGYAYGVGLYVRVPQTELTYDNICQAIDYIHANEAELLKKGEISFPKELAVSQDQAEKDTLFKLIDHCTNIAFRLKQNSELSIAVENAKNAGAITQEELARYIEERERNVFTPKEKEDSERWKNTFWKKVAPFQKAEQERREQRMKEVIAQAEENFDAILDGTQPFEQKERAFRLFDYILKEI